MKPLMVRVLLKFSFLSCNPRCSLIHAISLLTALSYSFLSAILSLLQGLSCSLHCSSPQWPLPVSSFDLCSFTEQRRFSNSSVLLCLHLRFWACQVWIHHCKTHVPFSTLASVQRMTRNRNHITNECEIWEHTIWSPFLKRRTTIRAIPWALPLISTGTVAEAYHPRQSLQHLAP